MKNVVLVLAILLLAAMAVIDLTYESGTQADVVYNMANQHIEWHYAGK